MKHTIIAVIFMSHFATSLAQNIVVPEYGVNFLFSLGADSYLISKDSIYCLSEPKAEYPKPHYLTLNKLKFLDQDSVGYLKNRSGGVIYSFDGHSFTRLDRSFPFKSQNFSYSFLHDNKIMNFGGYGLFSFKNILTYFSFDKKETEIFPQKSAYADSPAPRHKIIGQYKDGELFIGPGYGILPTQKNPTEHHQMIFDYWKFSFKTSEWTKLGDGNLDMDFPDYVSIDNYNGNVLVLTENTAFECDIKNNLLISYPDAKTNIVSTMNKTFEEYKITYNKAQGGFYCVLNKTDKAEVIFISQNDFLGTKKIYSKLYQETSNMTYYILGILLLVVLTITYFKLSKNESAKLKSQLPKIRNDIKQEDFNILKKLVDAYPDYLNYSELFDVFPDHYGYESKQKKARQSIVNLEKYMSEKMHRKSHVFLFRQSNEDRRIKQIKIR
jgi:hypothetical protein